MDLEASGGVTGLADGGGAGERRCRFCGAARSSAPDSFCEASRQLTNATARGDLAAAYSLFGSLAAGWPGLDLSAPGAAGADATALSFPVPDSLAYPLCLALVLAARAELAAQVPDAAPGSALAWHHAAFVTAVQTQRYLGRAGQSSAELAQAAASARRGMATAARALAPEIGAELLAGMALPAPGMGIPPACDPTALAVLFVQLVCQGRSFEAARLETALTGDALAPRLEADVLFCRGILALNARKRPDLALAFFNRCATLCAGQPDLARQEALAREHAAMASARLVPQPEDP